MVAQGRFIMVNWQRSPKRVAKTVTMEKVHAVNNGYCVHAFCADDTSGTRTSGASSVVHAPQKQEQKLVPRSFPIMKRVPVTSCFNAKGTRSSYTSNIGTYRYNNVTLDFLIKI